MDPRLRVRRPGFWLWILLIAIKSQASHFIPFSTTCKIIHSILLLSTVLSFYDLISCITHTHTQPWGLLAALSLGLTSLSSGTWTLALALGDVLMVTLSLASAPRY